jgi:hypothetical protein
MFAPIGFNPVWMETFKFRLDVPDLAAIEFKVSVFFNYKIMQNLFIDFYDLLQCCLNLSTRI